MARQNRRVHIGGVLFIIGGVLIGAALFITDPVKATLSIIGLVLATVGVCLTVISGKIRSDPPNGGSLR